MQNAMILMLTIQCQKLKEVKTQLRLAQNQCTQLYEAIHLAYDGEETIFLYLALDQMLEKINSLQSHCDNLERQYVGMIRQEEELLYAMYSY